MIALKFKVQQLSWCKRRRPTQGLVEPVSVEVPDFKKEHNMFCDMIVTYSDTSTKTIWSRVIQNSITKEWKVDGMHVAAALIEEI